MIRTDSVPPDAEPGVPLRTRLTAALASIGLWRERSGAGTGEEMDEIKQVLLRQAGHDLRTPLTVIKGFVSVLRRFPELPRDKRLEYLAAIDRHCDRLSRLADDVGDVMRLQEREPILHLEEVRIVDVVHRAVLGSDVPATMDVPAELAATVDPVRVEQLLFELLRNAWKHGGPPYRVTAMRQWRSLLVSVVDHGPGVPPEHRDRIFEPFYGTSPDGGGLGLAFARLVVEGHGGRLFFDPHEPNGSRFTLVLPLRPSSAGELSAPRADGMREDRRARDVSGGGRAGSPEGCRRREPGRPRYPFRRESDRRVVLEIMNACDIVYERLGAALGSMGVEPSAIRTYAEAHDHPWDPAWGFDVWCAWHACRIALRRPAARDV